MTEATQTTFFRDFFGKEMSENSDLANELMMGGARQPRLDGSATLSIGKPLGIVWVSYANGGKSPTAPFLVWAPPSSYFEGAFIGVLQAKTLNKRGYSGGRSKGFASKDRGASILHGYPDRSRGTGERESESSKLKRERETERERAKPFALSFGHPV